MEDQQRYYSLSYDNAERLSAQLCEGVTMGMRTLSETDSRRVRKGHLAYVILDIDTPLGVMRVRDLVIKFSERNKRHYIHYRQWWTGRYRNGRKDYLDVAGPWDHDTRMRFQERILEVYLQVKEEAAQGTLANHEGLKSYRERLSDQEEEPSSIEAPTPVIEAPAPAVDEAPAEEAPAQA